jgi:serine/threonine protein kinase
MKLTDVGTFLYTSPEVATEVYDEKCDVFSLGVVRWLPSDGASHWPLMAPLIGL